MAHHGGRLRRDPVALRDSDETDFSVVLLRTNPTLSTQGWENARKQSGCKWRSVPLMVAHPTWQKSSEPRRHDTHPISTKSVEGSLSMNAAVPHFSNPYYILYHIKKSSAPGRIRTCVDQRSRDLQSLAIDHSATDAMGLF